jgi:hypothetical protein
MGVRFRLKADYDISGFSVTNQIILTALKKYGMMVAENGSAWYISGAPDPRWNDDDLHNLTAITGADFEAVDDRRQVRERHVRKAPDREARLIANQEGPLFL